MAYWLIDWSIIDRLFDWLIKLAYRHVQCNVRQYSCFFFPRDLRIWNLLPAETVQEKRRLRPFKATSAEAIQDISVPLHLNGDCTCIVD